MTPDEQAEYMRRREAREARQREIDAAAGRTAKVRFPRNRKYSRHHGRTRRRGTMR